MSNVCWVYGIIDKPGIVIVPDFEDINTFLHGNYTLMRYYSDYAILLVEGLFLSSTFNFTVMYNCLLSEYSGRLLNHYWSIAQNRTIPCILEQLTGVVQ